MTISVSAHGGAYTRTLKSEKLLAQLCPVVGEIVVTNDWCTMLHTIVPLITAYCFVFMVLSRKLPSLEHHHTDVMFRMSQKKPAYCVCQWKYYDPSSLYTKRRRGLKFLIHAYRN